LDHRFLRTFGASAPIRVWPLPGADGTAGTRVPSTFQIERLLSVGNLRDRSSPHNRKKCRYLGVISAAKNGSHLAVVLSMRNEAAVDPDTGFKSFMRSSRAFAGASLVALAFGFAVFLIGLPLALGVRVVHESLSWLARLGGETGPVAEALVSVASVVGGIMLTVVFARALIGFFRWRGALRRGSRAGDRAAEAILARQLRIAES
jgi:hypothetical protein